MKDYIKTVDSMDISDREKRHIHEKQDEMKREYLNKVGEEIKHTVDECIDPRVEHTHQGLNLRIVAKEDIEEIQALGKMFGLNLVQERPVQGNWWIRFKFNE